MKESFGGDGGGGREGGIRRVRWHAALNMIARRAARRRRCKGHRKNCDTKRR